MVKLQWHQRAPRLMGMNEITAAVYKHPNSSTKGESHFNSTYIGPFTLARMYIREQTVPQKALQDLLLKQ